MANSIRLRFASCDYRAVELTIVAAYTLLAFPHFDHYLNQFRSNFVPVTTHSIVPVEPSQKLGDNFTLKFGVSNSSWLTLTERLTEAAQKPHINVIFRMFLRCT